MSNEYRLSVIVPIYNVEQYVEKAINSIISQKGFENTEIVVVNDGSKDKSREIVARLATNTENIVIIDQENLGLGGARNTGMKNATGKYIMFIDSDDYIEKDCLEKFLDIADNNSLDMLQLGHVHVDEDGTIFRRPINPKTDGVVTGADWLISGGADPASCFHLYNRQFLKSTNVEFLEHVYHEDMDFTFHVMYKAKRLMSINDNFYFYLDRDSSITGEKSMRKCRDYFKVAKHVSDWVNEEVDQETYNAFFKEYLSFLFIHPVNLCVSFRISLNDYLTEDNRLEEILKHIKLNSNLKYRLAYYLLKTKNYGLYEMMCRKNNAL